MAIADQLALPRVEGDVNTPLLCGQAHTPRTQTALIPKHRPDDDRRTSRCLPPGSSAWPPLGRFK
jgi:hypothetical protein